MGPRRRPGWSDRETAGILERSKEEGEDGVRGAGGWLCVKRQLRSDSHGPSGACCSHSPSCGYATLQVPRPRECQTTAPPWVSDFSLSLPFFFFSVQGITPGVLSR